MSHKPAYSLGINSEQLKENFAKPWKDAKGAGSKKKTAAMVASWLNDNISAQLQIALDSQATQRWSALAPAIEKAQAAIIQGMYENPELWKHVSEDSRNLIASLPRHCRQKCCFVV